MGLLVWPVWWQYDECIICYDAVWQSWTFRKAEFSGLPKRFGRLKWLHFKTKALLISLHWRPAVPKRVAFSTEFCKNRKQSSETDLKSWEVGESEPLGFSWVNCTHLGCFDPKPKSSESEIPCVKRYGPKSKPILLNFTTEFRTGKVYSDWMPWSMVVRQTHQQQISTWGRTRLTAFLQSISSIFSCNKPAVAQTRYYTYVYLQIWKQRFVPDICHGFPAVWLANAISAMHPVPCHQMFVKQSFHWSRPFLVGELWLQDSVGRRPSQQGSQ